MRKGFTYLGLISSGIIAILGLIQFFMGLSSYFTYARYSAAYGDSIYGVLSELTSAMGGVNIFMGLLLLCFGLVLVSAFGLKLCKLKAIEGGCCHHGKHDAEVAAEATVVEEVVDTINPDGSITEEVIDTVITDDAPEAAEEQKPAAEDKASKGYVAEALAEAPFAVAEKVDAAAAKDEK
jgi:hypothetical protein